MQAATAPDLSTTTAPGAPTPRLGPAAGSGGAPGRDPSTTSITVTLHIDVRGEGIPAAVTGLLESVRGLAGPAAVTVTHTAAPPPIPPSAWPRPRLVRGAEPPPSAVPVLRVYLDSRLVLRGGVPIRLTRREYDLLTFLCQHPRRVFSRRQLMRQVWGHEMVGGERTVDVHVRRLRVKLDAAGPVISTVRGVGYRLDDVNSVAIVGDAR